MREGGGSCEATGNRATRAGGATPGAAGPGRAQVGACEPWEEVEAGQAAQAESGRGLPRPEGKKLLFGPGRKRMGECGS